MAKFDGFNDEDIIVIENKESAIKIKDESESLGLTKMFTMIEADKDIKCVYAYELSRIGRKQTVNLSVKDFLVSHKVNLKIKEPSFSLLDRDGNLNNGTELVFSLFNTMAEQEMRLKKARLARGTTEAKERGEIGGGTVLFGYVVGADKRIYIDEEKARVVRYIFNAYKDGMANNKIYDECYERGWLKRMKNAKTESAFIRKMVAVVTYMGTYTDSGIVRYPQIISKELWEEVEQTRKKNITNKKNTKNCYLGKGLLFHEGYTLRGINKNQYKATDRSYYVGMGVMDYILWETTKELKLMAETQNNEERLKELEQMIEDLQQKIEGNRKHLEELDERQQKIEDLFIIAHKSKEWLQQQMANIERDRRNFSELMNEYITRFENVRNAQIHIGTVDINRIIMIKELDRFCDTVEKKKEIVDEQIKRVEVIDGDGVRKVTVESKKFGMLPYYFEYKRSGSRVWLYKVKVKKDGTEERELTPYIGRYYKKD